MSRENFCQKVQCPFWNPKSLGCDRFTTAYQCPIRKELPPDTYDTERKAFTDSYATQYALYWDDRCLPFDRLEGKLMSFLIGDRHYQQLAYLSEFEDPSTYTLRRRVDSGTFFRTLKIKSAYLPVTRELIHEVNPSWSLVKIDSFNLCTFSFPVTDLLLFDEYIEDLEAVGDE